MRTIQAIYTEYKIPPNLQLHMYRVAAIGLYVTDHLVPEVKVDISIITKVNLFHDIGNIIKYDFRPGKLLDIHEDEIPYWKKVQSDFIQKYGAHEHRATETIAEELNFPSQAQMFLQQTGIPKIEYALHQDDWNAKVIRYSDERVSPQGVAPIDDRYQDILARYEGRDHALANTKDVLYRKKLVEELEKQIQEKCTIDLQKISDADIEPYIETLHDYEI